MRRLIAGVLGIACLGLLPAECLGRVHLATTIGWTDAAGRTGVTVFQGVADGSALKGIAEIDGDVVTVKGTVAADGSVQGTIKSLSGQPVGQFSGTYEDAELVEGTLTLHGHDGGVWVAPSDGGHLIEVPQPPGPPPVLGR